MTTQAQAQPSPMLFFQTMWGPQAAGALKAGIELDVFTAIDEGKTTVEQLAEHCQSSPRGMRILCDYLTIQRFLEKEGTTYRLTPDSAVFLNRRSPAYLGSTVEFLASPLQIDLTKDVAGAVRRGGSLVSGPLEPNFPEWVRFARAMMPMMRMPAQEIGNLLAIETAGPLKVLDIAAGHGIFGITLAQRNPQVQVAAVDWAPVLEVASENARSAGVADRYHTIPGSAFEVDPGTGYDLVLLTNFLHHFDQPTCVGLLRRLHAAVKPGGRMVALDFVPNEDRVTPPSVAFFSMTMLLGTPAGDAYTFEEFSDMLTEAGFSGFSLHAVPNTPMSIVLAKKS